MLALLKGLPLGYQRDLQEDKPPLFESVATLEASLGVMAGLVATLSVDRDADARGGRRGLHDRDGGRRCARPAGRRRSASAHHVVGELVAAAESAGVRLGQVEDDAIEAALAASSDIVASGLAGDAAVAEALRGAATVESAVAGSDVLGGTAPSRVAAALAAARDRLGATERR